MNYLSFSITFHNINPIRKYLPLPPHSATVIPNNSHLAHRPHSPFNLAISHHPPIFSLTDKILCGSRQLHVNEEVNFPQASPPTQRENPSHKAHHSRAHAPFHPFCIFKRDFWLMSRRDPAWPALCVLTRVIYCWRVTKLNEKKKFLISCQRSRGTWGCANSRRERPFRFTGKMRSSPRNMKLRSHSSQRSPQVWKVMRKLLVTPSHSPCAHNPANHVFSSL